MAVKKINGFAAPYRSSTLRNETDALIGRNGVLYISQDIYEIGGDVIIPPFEVVQEGMVISKTNQTNITKPLSLEAPYYVTVSAPTPVNTNDLVFQFAKTPLDVAPNEVILAEYDGNEWRQQTRVSVDGLIKDLAIERIKRNQIGPYSGLITTTDGPNFRNSSGLLFDKLGDSISFDSDILFPQIPSDPEVTWRRTDRIVYRRATDSENRVGVRKLLIGGSYAPTGPKKLYDTALNTGSDVSTTIKTVIATNNSAMIFYAEGFGSNFSIKYRQYSSNRATQTGAGTVVSGITSSNFNVAIDSSNHCHIIYEDSSDIKLLIIDLAGLILYGPLIVDGLTNPCSNPQIVIDPDQTKSFIAFEYLEGPSNKQIYLATRSLSGVVITPPIKVTSTLSNIINPSIDVSDDLLVYLAYQDAGVIKYQINDDIGQLIQPAVTISGSTGSTSYGTLVHNASNPVIKITDNKTIFCAFRQRKTISSFGVAIYSNGSAFMPNLVNIAENITCMSMVADSFNNDLHFSIGQATSLHYILVKDLTVALAESLQASGVQYVDVVKDRLGSLVHAWSNLGPGTFTNTGLPQAVENIGPIAISGVLNTLVLGPDELSFDISVGITPQVGMRITLSGSSAGNDGSYIITEVELQNIDAVGDTYVVKVTPAFPASEAPALGVTSQFASPNGNICRFAKTVADTTDTRSLRTDTLTSDILLARISWPGPLILNYIPITGVGVNSDLFGMYGDVDVDWSATASNTFTMTNGTTLIDLVTSDVYTINGGSFPMNDGDALYITLDGSNFNITPIVSPINALPWANPIQVLGFVKNNEFNPHLFSVAGMGQLDVGEEIVLGEDLSKTIRIRLGISSESSVVPYSSTNLIAPSDSYPQALSALDSVMYQFITNSAEEEDFSVGVGGQTIFTKTVISDWSPFNSEIDICVFVNGIKQKQDINGGLNTDFRKTSATTIQFSYIIPENAIVTIRNERTGSPPITGGSVDLTNITTNPQPVTNAAFSLGSVSKAWKSLYLKDTTSSQVYELKIIGGVLQAVTVP